MSTSTNPPPNSTSDPTTNDSKPAPSSPSLLPTPRPALPLHAPKDFSLAEQFHLSTLSYTDLHPSPLIQFQRWLNAALSHPSIPHAETCTLSTAHLPSGRVSSRMVYLKSVSALNPTTTTTTSTTTKPASNPAGPAPGFIIYSNWETSRKAADMATNPFAALTFWWEPLERQVRVEGPVERLGPEESQVYFDTRVRGSRVGAWASRQSEVLWSADEGDAEEKVEEAGKGDGRQLLERRVEEVGRRFERVERIPVPPFWGGVRVIPDTVEFWQGRENRLHDRFRYRRVVVGDGGEGGKEGEREEIRWRIERLSP